MNTPVKGRRIAAWILTILISVLFFFSATFKFLRAQPAVEAMEKWGLAGYSART